MLIAMERVDTGSQSEDAVPHGAEPGRYSSSLKRALNPAVEETGTRKKVSLTSLSNGGKETDVGAKSLVQTLKKPAGHRPLCKKGDLEHAVTDVVAEKVSRVTRSRVKNTLAVILCYIAQLIILVAIAVQLVAMFCPW
jgi:hypothetical protein